MIKLKDMRTSKKPMPKFITSRPFVKNKKGVLIHRIVAINKHFLMNKFHYSIHFECGNMACGKIDKFELLNSLDCRDVVCERCETEAIKRGKKSSSDICGKHIHVGKVKALITCCKEESND